MPCEENVIAAQAYFSKRNHTIVTCLKAMVDSAVSAITECSSSIKSPNSEATLTEITTSNGAMSQNTNEMIAGD